MVSNTRISQQVAQTGNHSVVRLPRGHILATLSATVAKSASNKSAYTSRVIAALE
jgi:hypothetical protein